MDPNANLEELRKLVKEISLSDKYDPPPFSTVDRFVELVEALDNWMSSGGFPPDAWMPLSGRRLPCTNSAFKKDA